jgi:hypothetical protein
VAPQFEQNLPDACAWQDGHSTVSVEELAAREGVGEGLIGIKVKRRAGRVGDHPELPLHARAPSDTLWSWR